ncbi:DUF1612 domain-containing protein [Rhodoblastus acidophilus]|uniref:DUF1612 domain-containing protein n=1 Tax=Rhodoblastus acidophilus TaxID=1074 RepID=UPI001FCECEA2|nr:DUF1612 domain-containing protein [Rhodoblastus acidophilus]
MAARRQIFAAAPDWALSPAGLATLRGGGFLPEGEGRAETAVADEDEEGAGALFADADDPADDDPLAAELAALDAALARTNLALERKPVVAREDRDPLVYDLDWDENERLDQWRDGVAGTADLPPVLAAAIAAVLWDDIEPLQHVDWLGRLLVAALLRQRGKTASHLMCVNSGARAAGRLRRKQGEPVAKILFWLAARSRPPPNRA